MSAHPAILGLGLADARGVAGTACAASDWPRESGDPLSAPGAFRRLFGRSDPTYRRIDRMSRALVLAAEAAGAERALPEGVRADTAIALETARGCLDADLRFAAGLAAGVVLGPVFPYTLPSTCLGELALRHGLRGPTVCLSTGPDEAGAALREAAALLAAGEASHALAASVEVLARGRAGVAPALRAVVVLLGPAGAPSLAPWPARGVDPFAVLAAALARPLCDAPPAA